MHLVTSSRSSRPGLRQHRPGHPAAAKGGGGGPGEGAVAGSDDHARESGSDVLAVDDGEKLSVGAIVSICSMTSICQR
jgi:hypothetical protein